MYIVSRTLINILNILDSIKNFLSSLTTIDIIFFFAVLLLMILLVTLLYFIKTNADYVEPDNNVLKGIEEIKSDNVTSNYVEPENIGMYTSLNNISQSINDDYKYSASNNNLGDYDDEEGELFDLETITKKLESKELAPIDLTDYEEEQEKDAIISYEELLNRSNNQSNPYVPNIDINNKNNDYNVVSYDIPYKKEIMLDDLLVKEVDIKGLEESTGSTKTISYGEEEAFLSALKQLQEQLR